MKTYKHKTAAKKYCGNAFDRALLRLGQHVLPQQPNSELTGLSSAKKA